MRQNLHRGHCTTALVVVLAACSPSLPRLPPVPPGATTLGEIPADTQTVRGVALNVDLVTDRYGGAHVFATSFRDAAFGEGFAMARDRMAQMELFRRTSSGTLAEVYGALSTLLMESDITMRTLGLRNAAQATWDQMPQGRARDAFAGFADGVTAYLRQLRAGQVRGPRGSEALLTGSTADWTPVDSLTVLRFMELNLSYNADAEINLTLLRDRARTTFDQADPTATPDRAARRGLFVDLARFDPPSTAVIVPGFYAVAPTQARHRSAVAAAPAVSSALARPLLAMRSLFPLSRRLGVGTNAWGVAGSSSASGHSLLANDPHMPLIAPSILWRVHLVVTAGADATDVTGCTFPGVPGAVMGHTTHLAWGITNAMFDLMDVYAETVTPGTNGNPDTVLFQGRQVPLQSHVEHVPNGVFGTQDVTIETVPHHGPLLPTFLADGRLVPRTGGSALSVRWVGAQATHEPEALMQLLFVSDTAAAQTLVQAAELPGLGFVFADDAGSVAYRVTGSVPIRAPGAHTFDPITAPYGTMAASVLPGTGEAEWIGTVDPSTLPHATSGPGRPWVVAANNDPAGLSRDDNPFAGSVYLGYDWSEGFRAERIAQRLTALGDHVTREDMESIQADHVVLVGERFVPFVRSAIASLQDEWATPGRHPELTALAHDLAPKMTLLADAAARFAAWSFDTPSGLEPGATDTMQRDAVASSWFHAWVGRVVDFALSDELALLRDDSPGGTSPTLTPEHRMIATLFLLEHPDGARTIDPTTGQSALWDDLRTPGVRETRDEILLRALVAAADDLTLLTQRADTAGWAWGTVHTVRFASALPNFILSFGADLSIPPPGDPSDPNGFARPGGIDTVDPGWPALQDGDGHPSPIFSYSQGPARRMTVEMAPNAPIAFDALPGGASGDLASSHFRDEAALWRVNQTHALFRTEAEVAGNAEARTRFVPAP